MSLGTLCFLAALALIVAGVGMLSMAAALIVAGVLLGGLTWMLDGSTEDTA